MDSTSISSVVTIETSLNNSDNAVMLSAVSTDTELTTSAKAVTNEDIVDTLLSLATTTNTVRVDVKPINSVDAEISTAATIITELTNSANAAAAITNSANTAASSTVTIGTELTNSIAARPATRTRMTGNWMTELDAIEFPSHSTDCRENSRMTFFKLCNTVLCDKKSCIHWLMSKGLLATSRTCSICGSPMKLKRTNDSTDYCAWLCKRQKLGKRHFKMMSLRSDSWFHGANMTLEKVLQLMYIWANGYSSSVVYNELGISSETLVDWFYYCREVCEFYLLEMSQVIGGPDKVVEIYESDFIQHKFSRGDRLKGKWVFGGIERYTSDVFFIPVDDKKEKTLCSLVSKWIRPGTTIYSDCWESFTKLKKMGYQHKTTNHNKYSGDSDSSGNATEKKWLKAKNKLSWYANHKKCFSGYLAENLWRMNVREKEDKFLAFLEATKYVYNPLNPSTVQQDTETTKQNAKTK